MRVSPAVRGFAVALLLLLSACAAHRLELQGFTSSDRFGERVRVLELYPGVTATLVAPANLDLSKHVELILYALPNGNTTAETMGRLTDSIAWRYDIQHIGAQTRALRTRGLGNAVVAYLEADTKSWPEWRRVRGYDRANPRIVAMVDEIRRAIGSPQQLAVTLTGHSGGGSFTWGFIDGQDLLPAWLEKIAFLDSNYSFEPQHGEKIAAWLRTNPRNTLIVVAYDDREIMLDGKKVVSDSGGTWRATHRMLDFFRRSAAFTEDRLGEFIRYSNPQMELLLHPNPENRILHTVMIGEMNAYMHALLLRRPSYRETVLKTERAYTPYVSADITLPPASPPSIPMRAANAPTGSAFMASLAGLSREAREDAIRRELLAGNIPSFLRALRSVQASATGADGVRRTITYDVMPDYLAIGSDADYVRVPMNPYTAQAFCDAFGFALPTRKIVNDTWSAATVHLDPRPLTEERESPHTFEQHHRIIEEQLAGKARGGFVAGHKKDVVVSNKLLERPERVAIYGWHYPTGQPIQPLYAGHVDWYVDYSHGIRPVRRAMRVDGTMRPFEKLLGDSLLHTLVSDEGVITTTRYERK